MCTHRRRNTREGANPHARSSARGKNPGTTGGCFARGGTQYCGSISLNKVNFCREASEYGNFVFRQNRLGDALAYREYRLSIYFIYPARRVSREFARACVSSNSRVSSFFPRLVLKEERQKDAPELKLQSPNSIFFSPEEMCAHGILLVFRVARTVNISFCLVLKFA